MSQNYLSDNNSNNHADDAVGVKTMIGLISWRRVNAPWGSLKTEVGTDHQLTDFAL